MSSDTSRTATKSPNDLLTPSMRRNGRRGGAAAAIDAGDAGLDASGKLGVLFSLS